MQASDIPTKFPIPFANNASGSYIRAIPEASQPAGAASLYDGFPPVTFSPVGSGGVPPAGQDFNGILNQITAWSQWQNAGGLVKYDSVFSGEIGGYPQGAILAGAVSGVVWLSTADNNTTDPDTGGAGWLSLSTSTSQWAGTFGGTANALTGTLTPAPSTLIAGLVVRGIVLTSNTGAATININGLGAKSIISPAGLALASNDLLAGAVVTLTYTGSAFQLSLPLSTLYAVPAYSMIGNSTSLSAPAAPMTTAQARALPGITLRGHIYGMGTSNDATTPNTVVDFAAGECASDATTPTLIVNPSAFTKSIASTFTAGSGNGGLDTGTVANGWYYPFAIAKADGSAPDYLFSLSPSAPTMPSGYTLKRRTGALKYASGIVAFVQDGDVFTWMAGVTDYSGTARAKALLAVTVPPALRVRGHFNVQGQNNPGYNITLYDGIYSTPQENIGMAIGGGASMGIYVTADQFTNTSGQIYLYVSGTNFASLITIGWIDTRGRF